MPARRDDAQETVRLSPEDAILTEYFTFRIHYTEDGYIDYVQIRGPKEALDAAARNQPIPVVFDQPIRDVALSRMVMQRKLGRPLSRSELVIPINGKHSDLRRSNLELTTRAEMSAQDRDTVWSRTGHKYIYQTAEGDRYYLNYRNNYLGSYDTIEEAAEALDRYLEALESGATEREAKHRIQGLARNRSRFTIED